jgi:hypothetical protein
LLIFLRLSVILLGEEVFRPVPQALQSRDPMLQRSDVGWLENIGTVVMEEDGGSWCCRSEINKSSVRRSILNAAARRDLQIDVA